MWDYANLDEKITVKGYGGEESNTNHLSPEELEAYVADKRSKRQAILDEKIRLRTEVFPKLREESEWLLFETRTKDDMSIELVDFYHSTDNRKDQKSFYFTFPLGEEEMKWNNGFDWTVIRLHSGIDIALHAKGNVLMCGVVEDDATQEGRNKYTWYDTGITVTQLVETGTIEFSLNKVTSQERFRVNKDKYKTIIDLLNESNFPQGFAQIEEKDVPVILSFNSLNTEKREEEKRYAIERAFSRELDD